MTPNRPDRHLVDTMRNASAELIADFYPPLIAINAYGYDVLSSDVSGYDYMPWSNISGFIAADAEGHIHWLHPDLREQLNLITPEFIREVLDESSLNLDLRERESLTDRFASDTKSALADLDRRTKALSPFLKDIQALANARQTRNAAHASQADVEAKRTWRTLNDLIAQHEIDHSLAWEVLALRTGHEVGWANGSSPMASRAFILSKFLPQGAQEQPDREMKQRLAALTIASPEAFCEDTFFFLAKGIASGVYPGTFTQVSKAIADDMMVTIAKITQGHLDPRTYENVASHDSRLTIEIGAMASQSMHKALPVIAAAKQRLELLGFPTQIEVPKCIAAYQRDQEIPF